MQLTGYELIDKLNALSTFEEKRDFMKAHDYFFRAILYYAFHPYGNLYTNIVPKYRPSGLPPGMGWTDLPREFRNRGLDKFLESADIKRDTKERVLIRKLESMETREAELLASVIRRDLELKGLSYPKLQEVYPDLLP